MLDGVAGPKHLRDESDNHALAESSSCIPQDCHYRSPHHRFQALANTLKQLIDALYRSVPPIMRPGEDPNASIRRDDASRDHNDPTDEASMGLQSQQSRNLMESIESHSSSSSLSIQSIMDRNLRYHEGIGLATDLFRQAEQQSPSHTLIDLWQIIETLTCRLFQCPMVTSHDRGNAFFLWVFTLLHLHRDDDAFALIILWLDQQQQSDDPLHGMQSVYEQWLSYHCKGCRSQDVLIRGASLLQCETEKRYAVGNQVYDHWKTLSCMGMLIVKMRLLISLDSYKQGRQFLYHPTSTLWTVSEMSSKIAEYLVGWEESDLQALRDKQHDHITHLVQCIEKSNPLMLPALMDPCTLAAQELYSPWAFFASGVLKFSLHLWEAIPESRVYLNQYWNREAEQAR